MGSLQYYLPVMRKKRVRITRRVNPPTAAVAMTRICPCSAAISEAGKKDTTPNRSQFLSNTFKEKLQSSDRPATTSDKKQSY